MPRFCANLTMLYNEHGFLGRFAAAQADGFTGVEYMFPYAFRKEDLAEALERNGLTRSCTTCRPETGRRVSAGLPAFPTE